MKKFNILPSITRNLNRIKFKAVKASPELLLVAGAISIVGGTIAACKATTKLDQVLDESRNKIEKFHDVAENPEKYELKEEYTEKDMRHDLFITYSKEAVDIVKLYAPAVALTTLGIACMFGSHNILSKRNAALAAAYATVDKGFKEYRKRVVERFGKDMDRELRFNIKSQEFEEKTIDAKGKEKIIKKNVDVVSDDPSTYSEYAKFFDSSCREWEDNAEYNLSFLKNMENRANDLLRVNGHLFLNEVYDMLGIERTKAGQIVGWVYKKNSDEQGEDSDGRVDFGIFEGRRVKNREFVNGYEPVILLDFNVDGNILDMM